MNDRKVSQPDAVLEDHAGVGGCVDVSCVFCLLLIYSQLFFHSSLSPGVWKCEGISGR